MAKKIQHLRGTYEEYQNAKITPDAGEIALEEGEDGSIRCKVGDGKTPYTELPYLSVTVVNCTPESDGSLSLTLKNGYEYRTGTLASISLSLPTEIREDYTSSFVFDCFLSPASVNYPKEIVFCGDHCERGLFFPQKKTRYTVTLKNRTGAIYATVLAVPHDLAYQSYYEVVKERLPSLCAFKAEQPDKILDVALVGFFGYPDIDGYVSGLGAFNWSSEKYDIEFLWQNGCLLDYNETLTLAKGAGSYLVNRTDLTEESDGFSFLADTTSNLPLLNKASEPLVGDFCYRMRARVTLKDCPDTFSVGQEVPSPVRFYYTSGNQQLTMKYTDKGDFEIDFTTEEGKELTKVYFCGIGRSGRVFFPKGSISLVATKGDYTCESTLRRVVAKAEVDAPLHSAGEIVDTFSITSETVTRRVFADIVTGFSLHSDSGMYSVFKLQLPSPMERGSTGVLSYFTQANSLNELSSQPLHYYFDTQSGNGVLYFSGNDEVYDVDSMYSWIYENYEILGYAYKKATTTIEHAALPDTLVPYDGYTFLMLKNASNGAFEVTYYKDDKEEGEM